MAENVMTQTRPQPAAPSSWERALERHLIENVRWLRPEQRHVLLALTYEMRGVRVPLDLIEFMIADSEGGVGTLAAYVARNGDGPDVCCEDDPERPPTLLRERVEDGAR
jgi:hypothetical protein